MSGLLQRVKDGLYRSTTGLAPNGLGHGPYATANDGWVDNKPYEGYYSNGLFQGYDGSMWFYMAFPDDVQTRFLRKEQSIIETQSFFLNAVHGLAGLLTSQEDKLRGDLRRRFHVQVTQDIEHYEPPAGSTPAHADYLRRLNSQYTRPIWRSYFGVELLAASVFDKRYSWRDVILAYLDVFSNFDEVHARVFEQDRINVEKILTGQGFKLLDFAADPTDFERLTAWYGVSDDQFMLSRQLQDIHMEIPAHNRSVITPKWGEITMSALRPSERLDYLDPESRSTNTRWASPLLRPGSGVVCVNIRGQIRGDDVIDNLLDVKDSSKTKHSGSAVSSLSYGELVRAGRETIKHRHFPMLDNTEIIVASQVPKQMLAQTPLEKAFAKTGFEVARLEGRQDTAMLSTLPTYPGHVMRIPAGNNKRPHLSNAFFPGVLAFSTLFQSDRPLANSGIQLGLGDGQYQPIYVELDAASKYSSSPIWLTSGRPGSGKTQAMLNWITQAVMQGALGFYFNPKQTGTLKPTFDYLGGITVSLNREYLLANPGLADPFFFLESREDIYSVISDAIVTSLRMVEDSGTAATHRRSRLEKEIQERCKDTRNKTTHDVIFGNIHTGTQPLSDKEVVDFVSNKVKTSPFWRSFVAPAGAASAMKAKMDQARAILFEWDESMNLPDATKPYSQFTDNEIDTTLSLVTMFRYAVAKARTSGGNSMIICDEAHVLKASQQAMDMLNRAGREWREANINLILGTQQLVDFLGDPGEQSELTTFIGRFIMMAIAETAKDDFAWFYKLTELPNEKEGSGIDSYSSSHYGKYMVNAASGKTDKGKPVFRAYLVDLMYKYKGGIIVGPWPERELSIGRTDKEAKEARARRGALTQTYEQMLEDGDKQSRKPAYVYSPETGGYGGFLSDIAQESAQAEAATEAVATAQESKEREGQQIRGMGLSPAEQQPVHNAQPGVVNTDATAGMNQPNKSLTSGGNADKGFVSRRKDR